VRERSIHEVPKLAIAALLVATSAQVCYSWMLGAPNARAEDLPEPPALATLRIGALGEPSAMGKLLMLWLQAFDYQAGTLVPYRNLDYARLEGWLERIQALDPVSQYPLFSASRLYAEVPIPDKQRRMLDFIHRQYLLDPDRRWPALAHATVLAKHRLKDLPLAREYAISLQRNTKAADVPIWVTQMEVFILEDMNEIEAARIMLGGLIASGQVKDARDLKLLQRRLEGMGGTAAIPSK
jgi:hypothetical protein